MSSPDAGRFTPESALPGSFDSSKVTGRGRERFSRLRLVGAALVGAMLGVAFGAMFEGAAVAAGLGIPIERISSTPIAIEFIVVAGVAYGLLGAAGGVFIHSNRPRNL